MPALVVGTTFIATVHRRLASRFAAMWPVTVLKSPIAIDVMDQGLQWHKYRSQDPGLVWLRELAKRAAAKMDETNGNP